MNSIGRNIGVLGLYALSAVVIGLAWGWAWATIPVAILWISTVVNSR